MVAEQDLHGPCTHLLIGVWAMTCPAAIGRFDPPTWLPNYIKESSWDLEGEKHVVPGTEHIYCE